MTASSPPRSRFALLSALVLLSLLGVCAIFVGVQPSSYSILRDTSVRASEQRVHAVFADVRALAAWDPWPARPGVSRTTTFSATTTGLGAWVQWSSSDGTTRMTLVSESATSVEYRDDVDGRVDASRQLFGHGRVSRATTIGWTISGHNDLLRRALWPFAALERRIGPKMDASLARLAAMLDDPRASAGAR